MDRLGSGRFVDGLRAGALVHDPRAGDDNLGGSAGHLREGGGKLLKGVPGFGAGDLHRVIEVTHVEEDKAAQDRQDGNPDKDHQFPGLDCAPTC